MAIRVMNDDIASDPASPDWYAQFMKWLSMHGQPQPDPVAQAKAALAALAGGQQQAQPPDLPIPPDMARPQPARPSQPNLWPDSTNYPQQTLNPPGPQSPLSSSFPQQGLNPRPGMGAPIGPDAGPTPPMPPARPVRTPGAPNLGYYQPTLGNARGQTGQTYGDPNDPRIYKGPLSLFGRG